MAGPRPIPVLLLVILQLAVGCATPTPAQNHPQSTTAPDAASFQTPGVYSHWDNYTGSTEATLPLGSISGGLSHLGGVNNFRALLVTGRALFLNGTVAWRDSTSAGVPITVSVGLQVNGSARTNYSSTFPHATGTSPLTYSLDLRAYNASGVTVEIDTAAAATGVPLNFSNAARTTEAGGFDLDTALQDPARYPRNTTSETGQTAIRECIESKLVPVPCVTPPQPLAQGLAVNVSLSSRYVVANLNWSPEVPGREVAQLRLSYYYPSGNHSSIDYGTQESTASFTAAWRCDPPTSGRLELDVFFLEVEDAGPVAADTLPPQDFQLSSVAFS